MNTNMKRFKSFQKSLRPCPLDESSLNIGRVKNYLSNPLLTWLLYNAFVNKMQVQNFGGRLHCRLNFNNHL